jgi:urease accessory protein UreH
VVVETVVREATAVLVEIAETARTTVGEMTVAGRMAHQASFVHNSLVLVVVVLENRSATITREGGLIFRHSNYGYFTVLHALPL